MGNYRYINRSKIITRVHNARECLHLQLLKMAKGTSIPGSYDKLTSPLIKMESLSIFVFNMNTKCKMYVFRDSLYCYYSNKLGRLFYSVYIGMLGDIASYVVYITTEER